MTHPIPDETLRLIEAMDSKIGEFMQRRADVVNRLIAETAYLKAGDEVEIFDGVHFLFTGVVVQPLFVKRQGVISYRIRKPDGTIFTNETYRIERVTNSREV
ncbi:MAG: hypothetical protein V4543_08575 [Bacteroidota bacterium]